MKYEADILKRLINTYGVMGNPCYISEIIKEFIVQGKVCYPELFTYQSDWLAHIDEFGLNPSYTVSYTGQSIYTPNTLERPVKSAILKGNTMVNLTTTASVSGSQVVKYVDSKMTTNKTITIKLVIPSEVSSYIIQINNVTDNSYKRNITVTTNNYLLSLSSDEMVYWIRGMASAGWDVNNQSHTNAMAKAMIIEGDYTNQDVPYFEGMQSVKMPVLTTSNEDGTKTNILTTPQDLVLRGIGDVKDTLDLTTGELTQRIGEVVLDGSEDEKWSCNLNYDAFVYEGLIYNKTHLSTFPLGLVTWSGVLRYKLKPSELGISSTAQGRAWLSQNPITIQYQLEIPVIKTVDLTILDQNGQNVKQLMSFNGGTHFNTGSLEGSPLPSVSVSVETDLEETLKVCSLEGNTL